MEGSSYALPAKESKESQVKDTHNEISDMGMENSISIVLKYF